MRVLLITQGVSRLVEPLFGSSHKVVGVLESMPRDYHRRKPPGFIFRALSFLYKLFKPGILDLRSYCRGKDVPYNFLCVGREAEVTKWIGLIKPDLIVVFSMSQLLRQDVISIPRCGVINMHPSWLPEYRGPNPDFWQYYDVELNPGVTIHYIDAGEDTGDIIFQDRASINLGEKSPVVLNKLIGDVGVPLILTAIDAIECGKAPRIKQPDNSPTGRARNLKANEHANIIDWQNWPIERVWHVLRGTELWLNAVPAPRGIYTGQRWVVGEFVKVESVESPGTLTQFRGRNCIAAKDGYVFLSICFNFKKMVIGILQK